MKYIKDNYKFLIFVIIICIIGSYFTTVYSLSIIDKKALEEAIKQVGSKNIVIAITAIQTIIYAIIFNILGLIISNKVGLWHKFKKNKKAIITTIIASIIGGLCISLIDKYIFGYFIKEVYHQYDDKPTAYYIISCFTYGGVFEEILMRLFLMSLISLIISKLFYKKEKKIPTKVYIIANIICAVLFAAGHIPATIELFHHLNFLILLRCFLLNGALGLCFGYLYRKYSIHYSMLAHAGCHLLSITLRLLFI